VCCSQVKTLTKQAIGRWRERKRSAQLERQAAAAGQAPGNMVDLTTANSPYITSVSTKVRQILHYPQHVLRCVLQKDPDIINSNLKMAGCVRQKYLYYKLLKSIHSFPSYNR